MVRVRMPVAWPLAGTVLVLVLVLGLGLGLAR